MNHHSSVALLIVTVQACIGFVASMVAKYALLCTFCGRWSFLLVARYANIPIASSNQ